MKNGYKIGTKNINIIKVTIKNPPIRKKYSNSSLFLSVKTLIEISILY